MNYINSVLNPPRKADATLGLGSATAVSGSTAREDGRVCCGFSLMRGKRANMEDFHCAQFKKHPKSGEECGLFGVFDGHGGPNAADFVRSNLFVNLFLNARFPNDMRRAIVEAFEATDAQYLKQEAGCSKDDGCTGVTAIIVGSRMCVAHVGDSRAVLCRGGKAIALTQDHKPNGKEERHRIESAGGVVVWAGTWRVGGVLAVSRAFGDRPLKQYVIATPDTKEEQLVSEDEFIILASDGLWDVFSNADAVIASRDIADPEKAARKLCEEAIARGSNDNVSCVIIRLKL